MDDNLERSIASLETALEDAADARAKVEALEERRKQVLATMVVKYRADGKGIGECEHFARADPTYIAAASEWELANYDYRRTDSMAESKRLRFDAWRTNQSTERAKMQLR